MSALSSDLKHSSSLSSISTVDRDTELIALNRPPRHSGYSDTSTRRPSASLSSTSRHGYNSRDNYDIEPPSTNKHGHQSAKKRRKKRANPVSVNLAGTRYEVVRRMMEHFGFTISKDDDPHSFLIWNDMFVSTERISDLRPYQHINHFPGMGEVTRKDCLARNMMKILKTLPEDFSFVPKTWILPVEYNLLQNYMKDLRIKKKNRVFIMKPPNAAQGHGISLLRNMERVPTNESLIVQEYIDKPLLIDGYKFDLRIYVVITSCDPLRVFLYNDGLVRLSTEKYLHPQENNLHHLYMHLTNYSINKHNENYEKGVSVDTGSKRSIRYLNNYLRNHDYDVALLWKNISDLIIKTMIVATPHVSHAYRMCRPGMGLGTDSVCFEILGFDVIIDRKLRPWLLEINRSPSFGTDEKIDFDIKSGLIEDTLRLLNLKASDKKRNIAAQKAETQKRLLRPTKRTDESELSEVEKTRLNNERRKEELKELLSRMKKMATREDFENRNCGRLQRIFPSEDRHRQEKYVNLLISAFDVVMAGRSSSIQREIQLLYNNKLREQDILDMIADCERDKSPAKGTRLQGPQPLRTMPSAHASHRHDDENNDVDDGYYDEIDNRLRQQKPTSLSAQGSKTGTPNTSGYNSRPGSAVRPMSERRSVSAPRTQGTSRSPQRSKPFLDTDALALVVRECEEELVKRTLSSLNDMRIKFPGKSDEEAENILDMLHENWKYHKPRIASYWLVKLDSIKRRKVVDIVRSNVKALMVRVWRAEVDNLRLYRIVNRVFNRLLWSHGQGLWNCFSSSSSSWETIFSKSTDTVSAPELDCCRRIVQLCRDCLLIVYQFATDAKAGPSQEEESEHRLLRPSSGLAESESSSSWSSSQVIGQRVAKQYHHRAHSLDARS